MARARETSITTEPLTSRQQLSLILKDNQWHYFKTELACECSTCENAVERFYVRVRSDGRFLAISEEDASNWYDIEMGSGDTSNLMRVGIIDSKQCPRDERKPLERYADANEDKQKGAETTNYEDVTYEQDETEVAMNSNELETVNVGNTLDSNKIVSAQIEQAKQNLKVQPPCHCQSCSTLYWFSSKAQSSPLVLQHEKAAASVREWAQMSIEISEKIAQGLKQHGLTLRKRWAKKFTSKKQQHSRLLADVQASLEEPDTEGQQGERYLASKAKPFGRNLRCRLLTTALSPDALIDDPENLFQQFEDRSKHPSQCFYSDFHCMTSVSNARYSILQQYLIPGTFSVTPERYGEWQEWQDHEVHSFQSVAASVSFLVFESQCEILNILWEIFQRLAYGLSFPKDKATIQDNQEEEATPARIQLPTLINSQTIYVLYPARRLTVQDIYHLCSDQLDHAITELTTLRRSRVAFDRRKRLSEELHDALSSCEKFDAQQVLIEPHERVLWWLFIVEEAKALSDAFERLNDDASARLIYIERFKSLMITVRRRSDQLLRDAAAQRIRDAKAGTIVPASVIKMWGHAQRFLVDFAFCEPQWRSRFVNRLSCVGLLKPLLGDLPRMHQLIQEWVIEGLLISRVEEILMACEPTTLIHRLEPLNQEDHVRYKLYPSDSSDADDALSFGRDVALSALLLRASEQGDGEEASLNLCDIWERYQELVLHYYACKGFRPEWIEKVEDVWVCTDPGEVVESKPKPRPTRRPGRRPTTTSFHTTIPHHSGEERASARKLTIRTRTRLNSGLSEDDTETSVVTKQRVQSPEDEETQGVRITVNRSYLEIIEALSSNAQVNTKSVRWQTFCRFMKDVGCEISVSGSGGAATKFTWLDPRDEKPKTLTLHRPHPVPTLEPQMLRNVHTAIKSKFGWVKENFVTKR